MSKLDSVKSKIDFLKMFITALTIMFFLMFFLSMSINKLSEAQWVIFIVVIVFDVVALAILGKMIMKEINKLEDL